MFGLSPPRTSLNNSAAGWKQCQNNVMHPHHNGNGYMNNTPSTLLPISRRMVKHRPKHRSYYCCCCAACVLRRRSTFPCSMDGGSNWLLVIWRIALEPHLSQRYDVTDIDHQRKVDGWLNLMMKSLAVYSNQTKCAVIPHTNPIR